VLPEGVATELDADSMPLPPVFRWLAEQGNVSAHEMARTFNCGVGMIAVVPADRVDAALAVFHEHGEDARVIGRMVARDENSDPVRIPNLAESWGLSA
jgi:phosphoribosylformylglycinamidine cyclo-ligase